MCFKVRRLIDYIDENWDRTDPEIVGEICTNIDALKFAIDIVSKTNAVGEMNEGDKRYIIC